MNKKGVKRLKGKLEKESLKDKKELKEISLKLGDKKFNCKVESFCQKADYSTNKKLRSKKKGDVKCERSKK